MSRIPSAPQPKQPAHQPDSPEVLARVKDGMDLVEIVIRMMKRELGGGGLSLDEMRSYGQEALLKAARTFDPARGVPFRRWANLRIRGSIIDGIRTQQLPRRLYEKLRAIEAADHVQEALLEEDAAQPPRDAEAADARLDHYLATMATAVAVTKCTLTSNDELDRLKLESMTPEEALSRAELASTIREVVAARPEAERKLLEAYYIEDQTLEVVATSMGLSKSWASRLHTRALEGVARELKKRKIRGG